MVKKPQHFRQRLTFLAIGALVLLAWVLLRLPCPIRALTGIPCPGCGMSRAWLAFVRLDLAAAFRYHPLFWTVPLVVLLVLYDGTLFTRKRHNDIMMYGLIALLLLCYVVRLIVFFRGMLPL